MRWVVRYRTHGVSKVAPRHGGTFRRRADAEARERVIAGLIAEGRIGEIRRLLEASAGGRTIAELIDGVRDAMSDASTVRIERFRKARAALRLTRIGSIHVDDLSPSRGPCRGGSTPPPYTEWLVILNAMTPKHRPMLQVIERTGMRMKEVRNLTWATSTGSGTDCVSPADARSGAPAASCSSRWRPRSPTSSPAYGPPRSASV